MKCRYCNGTGRTQMVTLVKTDSGLPCDFPCIECGGTGEVEMTNEEWFCQLPTGEKADFFCTVQNCLTIYGDHIATHEGWMEWLKEKHGND